MVVFIGLEEVRVSRKKKKLHIKKEHRHQSVLKGDARVRAVRLGEVTAFVWMCNDPNCVDGHRGQ